MNYTRKLEQAKYDKLMEDCQVFWAFGEDQFKEGKKKINLKKGEKLTSIGSGGFMPNKHYKQFVEGMKAIDKWAKTSKKDDKAVILYELNNHECFYTGDWYNAMPRLKDLGYTEKQVKTVFRSAEGRKIMEAQA